VNVLLVHISHAHAQGNTVAHILILVIPVNILKIFNIISCILCKTVEGCMQLSKLLICYDHSYESLKF